MRAPLDLSIDDMSDQGSSWTTRRSIGATAMPCILVMDHHLAGFYGNGDHRLQNLGWIFSSLNRGVSQWIHMHIGRFILLVTATLCAIV